jgi:hypothetical protein
MAPSKTGGQNSLRSSRPVATDEERAAQQVHEAAEALHFGEAAQEQWRRAAVKRNKAMMRTAAVKKRAMMALGRAAVRKGGVKNIRGLWRTVV